MLPTGDQPTCPTRRSSDGATGHAAPPVEAIAHTCVSSAGLSLVLCVRRHAGNAICLPSGDHAGQNSALGVSVRRVTWPVSASTVHRSLVYALSGSGDRSLTNAM